MPLNIDRDPLNEATIAEDNGTFEYIPGLKVDNSSIDHTSTNLDSLSSIDFRKTSDDYHIIPPASLKKPTLEEPTQKPNADPPQESPTRRKSSLDDFELEIEGINLDDNIDTSVSKIKYNNFLSICYLIVLLLINKYAFNFQDVNIDDDLLSD